MTSDRVKIRFELGQEDDWPPVTSEGLWAVPLESGEYRLDNTPWFVHDVSADDIVTASHRADGALHFDERVRWGGRLTVRVIPSNDGPLAGSEQAVLDTFTPLGVQGEGFGSMRIVALDIGPDVDLASVKQLIAAGENDGRWFYDEGCVTEQWLAL